MLTQRDNIIERTDCLQVIKLFYVLNTAAGDPCVVFHWAQFRGTTSAVKLHIVGFSPVFRCCGRRRLRIHQLAVARAAHYRMFSLRNLS